jgi:transposase
MRNQTRRKCIQLLQQVQNNGDLRMAKRIMAVLSVVDGTLYSTIAATLNICKESIRLWFNAFLLNGIRSFHYKKPAGRPAKLTKKQRKKLDQLISQGPQKSGFPGACWRSPMV